MVETDGGSRDRRGLVTTKGLVPLCSGLTYSNRSNCLLTDKAAETNIAGESFNIFKTVAVYFNTRKLTRDEGDQNLRG